MKKTLFTCIALSLVLAACGDDSNGSGGGDTPEPTAECGNKTVEDGEACDDGNTDSGDGCTADCSAVEDGYTCPEEGGKCTKKETPKPDPKPEPEPEPEPEEKCGNGELDDGEACDDGNTSDGDGCAADCSAVEEGYRCDRPGYECAVMTCGDGVVDEGEDCDDGDMNTSYGFEGDCSESCHAAHFCGDGLLDQVDRDNGEQCDDGKENNIGGYGKCKQDCTIDVHCGDGIIQSEFEQCDDGYTFDGDGCSADCKFEPGFTCVTVNGKSVCSPLLCGNGKIDENSTELCDDGNRVSGDGCSMICLPERGFRCTTDETGKSVCEKTCGNGTVDTDAGEQCDDGNDKSGDGCSAACTVEPGYLCNDKGCFARACGDGIVAGAEECDDGNTDSDDGCSKFCTREENWHCDNAGKPCAQDICGDGIVTGDETCDEGHLANPANKTEGCKECRIQMGWKCDTAGAPCDAATCGNGILEGAETCEETNECCNGCVIQPYCACDAQGKNCVKGACGNGILEAGEQCDDGNAKAGDGCGPDCKIEAIFGCKDGICKAICGDGLTLVEAGEECDDGNLANGDGCSSDCKIEQGYTCTKFDNNEKPAVLNMPLVYRDFRAYHYGKTGNTNYGDYPNPMQGRGFFTPEEFAALPDHCKNPSTVPADTYTPANTYRFRHFPIVGSPIPDFNGNGCWGDHHCLDVIYPTLDKDGKPVLRPANEMRKGQNFDSSYENCHQLYTCPEVFAYWYRDTNMSVPVKTTLPMQKQTDGSYKFSSSNFWPLQNLAFNASDAEQKYGRRETAYGLFTSEFSTYFKYNGDETLVFSGDDDVWVFFNGQRVMEIAGIHGDIKKTVILVNREAKNANELDARTIGMYPGGIYPMQVFHAERCQGGSRFTLTLTGFVNMGQSECATVCGDGIVRGNEECDFPGDHNDVNLQHQFGCSADCKKQPFCGNGILEAGEGCDTTEAWCVNCKIATCGNGQVDEHEQCDKSAPNSDTNPHASCLDTCLLAGCGDGILQEGEQCDDGNLSDDDMCTSKCTEPKCGDGIVSPAIGEVCDDGVNDGSYGGCGFGCSYIPPACGDGIIDSTEGEECDDGKENNNGGYGKCKENCKRDAHCGDGVIQPEYEQCDPAISSGCSESCTFIIN